MRSAFLREAMELWLRRSRCRGAVPPFNFHLLATHCVPDGLGPLGGFPPDSDLLTDMGGFLDDGDLLGLMNLNDLFIESVRRHPCSFYGPSLKHHPLLSQR